MSGQGARERRRAKREAERAEKPEPPPPPLSQRDHDPIRQRRARYWDQALRYTHEEEDECPVTT